MTTAVPTSAPVRLQSLDVFRGLTMATMVVVNNPGDWGNVYWPLLHAEWHGCTPTDLVFPFFLFIVGFSITLSRKSGSWGSIVRRGLTIIALGLFLAGFPRFDLARWRVPGVLQRIGLCYLFAASLYKWCVSRWGDADQVRRDLGTGRAAAAVAAMLLLGYWAILLLVPGETGRTFDLTPEGNVGAMLDRAVFGTHTWKARWDPEGLLSTIPAIGTTLLGVIAGLWFRNAGSLSRRAVGLAAGGTLAALAGYAWGLVFPLNKALWTSSYAVFTAGLGAMVLALCVWLVDVRGWKRASHPFVVLGTNAMALFMFSGIFAKLLGILEVTGAEGTPVSLGHYLHTLLFVPIASPVNASLLYALANLVVLYAVLWLMYRRGIFWRV